MNFRRLALRLDKLGVKERERETCPVCHFDCQTPEQVILSRPTSRQTNECPESKGLPARLASSTALNLTMATILFAIFEPQII